MVYAAAGTTYLIEYTFGWNLDPALLDRAEELALRALSLDPSTGPGTDLIMARIPLAALYESEGRHEEARALAQEILRVNRDLTAESATALALTLGFDTDEAIGNLRSAGLP
jgi:tetratricopeptide (TPR) repeat protein